jgi:hypothetical protein
MLLGALIGLILISAFLITAGEPKPEWSKFWRIRPLIIVPLACACGGAFSYFMHHITYPGGWKRVLGIILSAIIFIIGLWLGTVLGLAGTYWN